MVAYIHKTPSYDRHFQAGEVQAAFHHFGRRDMFTGPEGLAPTSSASEELIKYTKVLLFRCFEERSESGGKYISYCKKKRQSDKHAAFCSDLPGDDV